LLTLAHTPFVMNTRIRAPLVDPLVAALAAGGWMTLAKGSLSPQALPRAASTRN